MTTSPIDEIEQALEAATPGRWGQFHPSYAPEAKGAPFSEWDSSHDVSAMLDGKRIKRLATFKHADDAAYLDAVQPVRMSAILSQARKAEALERENAALREALTPFARIADIEESTAPGIAPSTTVRLNLDLCRRARALLKGDDDAQ